MEDTRITPGPLATFMLQLWCGVCILCIVRALLLHVAAGPDPEPGAAARGGHQAAALPALQPPLHQEPDPADPAAARHPGPGLVPQIG